MSPKATFLMVGAAVLAAWYVERKIVGAASSAAGAVFSAINDGAQAAGSAVIGAYGAATVPVVPVSMSDPAAAQAAAGIANGIVAAPANAVDSMSMGLIGGSGGAGGNGGIAGMLWGIVSGEAFKPTSPDPTFDLGSGSGW
ncbi:hypothetical protein DF107_05735 [Burkholderia stagnalis]|uniref:hypothetical protein n=1 Tax=Burkholderia stagnalis TaxID=1503054 RepID=UPI000F594481|nr:hypothetical protein [Burkholderia stagnalis]RQQ20786.1 hypothetical protein DF161_03700 [Burkholderia stagnalis]RQY45472.1 hypothetical protein DF113_05350 [Burkholderia stagnalis]RQY84416.1 hypothetical protein DF107_05735 [Burkholderia stagnalis]